MNRIIIGGDDDSDLPDAIDVSELVPVPQSSSPQVDPRLRSRRIGVRRAEGRKRLTLVLIVLGIVVIVIGVLAFLASPLFSVKQVRVNGALYTTDEVLAPILATVDGEPILTVDTDVVRARIEALPWVRRAEVHTDFPHTLVIDVDERKPAAVYLGGDGRWRVIDRDGRIIAVELGQPIDYMAVEGTGPDLEPGSDAGPTFRALAELAETIRDLPDLAAVTDRLTLSTADEFGIVLRRGDGSDSGSGDEPETVVNLGPATNLRSKLAVLITLQREGTLVDAVSVDISDPAKPAVK
ncbi:MAG: cell division protein FtsQ/DivIB [Acidimicrobiia bacterium]